MKKFLYLFIVMLLVVTPVFAQDMTQSTDNQDEESTTQEEAQTEESISEEEQAVEATSQSDNSQEATYKIYENESIVYIPLNAKFSIMTEDTNSGVSRVEYSINERGFIVYDKPITFKNEGHHTLVYRVYDNVGNIEYVKTIKICVDASAPEMQLIPSSTVYEYKGLNFVSAGYQFHIKSHDSYSGVEKLYYSVNDQPFGEYSNAVTFDEAGTYSLKYYSRDNVGNISKINIYQFVVDAQKPTVEIQPSKELYEVDGIKYANSSYSYTINAFDSESGVKAVLVSVDGSEYLPYGGEITFETEGEHTITVQAIDNVNNQSEILEFKINVDNTPPTSDYSLTIDEEKEEEVVSTENQNQDAITDEEETNDEATNEEENTEVATEEEDDAEL